MSQENVDLARRTILGWNDRGVEAFIEALDPEVEFHPPKESMNPGIYRGHAGVRDYFARLTEIVQGQRVHSVDVIDLDDERVIAVTHATGRTDHFDGEIELDWAYLITVRNGKVSRVECYTDRAQALEAAGLSE